MASGWRLKPLHRLIVLSRPISDRRHFDPRPPRLTPKTRCSGAYRQRRLEAEVVRDSILAVSGRLNTRMDGPGFYPTLPAAVLAGQSVPGQGWGKSDEREQARRSIYIFAKRSLGVPEIELLDATRHHQQLRAANRLDNRTAGAGVPERGVHPRTGAALRRAVGRRSRAAPRQPGGSRVCAGTGRPPRPTRSQAALEFLDKARAADQGRDVAAQEPTAERSDASAKGPRGILPGRLEYE